MGKDVLDQTLLSLKAAERWHKHCMDYVRKNKIPDPNLIKDEQAYALEDGSLLLFAEVEGYPRCEMVIGVGEWGWFS